jgi:hypothetical protein
MGRAEKSRDEEYFAIVAKCLRVCAAYRPMFGKGTGKGQTLEQFRTLYGADPFYNWVGLDSPLLYAAHKAAGGMTSIYRQLGMGAERVIQKVLEHSLGLSSEDVRWSYSVPGPRDEARKLSLDGRVEVAKIRDKTARTRVQAWLDEASARAMVAKPLRRSLVGLVMEVRQGYKSKDSKRQNADIANAANAYAHLYLPTLVLLSTQIDGDLALRYSQAQWLILVGTTRGAPLDSTYAFFREVIGYDLAGFFERNSQRIKAELETVLTALLQPEA